MYINIIYIYKYIYLFLYIYIHNQTSAGSEEMVLG